MVASSLIRDHKVTGNMLVIASSDGVSDNPALGSPARELAFA
jgi:hypothetical protein